MYLKSITLKGFKSFPDRTRLEFGPGVSVIVGPNGSGKSNITDAVLWALGEQSPVAVRGQSMQDVIFGGAPGRRAGSGAEVELVLDDSEGSLGLGAPEVSIARRLDRSGEGEYRLSGARCRLVDVIELLSDTGLGKEMHSVISQGRVESLVTSKPRDRRLLIEEAAGLGKHRKRRRRAQLKLARTQDNLDRALDVEREARSRLRPLKRQAEAAELHARLERQTLEASWELARDDVRSARAALAQAGAAAADARRSRQLVESELQAVGRRREAAEEALARRSAEREELSRRLYATQSAGERISYRSDGILRAAVEVEARLQRSRAALAALEEQVAAEMPDDGAEERIRKLRAELAALERDHEAELQRQLADLEQQRMAAARTLSERVAGVEQRARARRLAAERLEGARASVREAERAVEAARRNAARVGGELAAANQFLRMQVGSPAGAAALAEKLQVDPGYELALAAVLDGRLRAAIVSDRSAGHVLLDGAGADGGRALVVEASSLARAQAGPVAAAPLPGAERLAEHFRGPEDALGLARALVADAWVVESLEELPARFSGTAVTRGGRVWSTATCELRQAPAVGEERILSERNRRDELIAATEEAARLEQAAVAEAERQSAEYAGLEAELEDRAAEHRAAVRERDEAQEEERRIRALIERRRAAPDERGTGASRLRLASQLASEQRVREHAERARAERAARADRLRAALARDEELLPALRVVRESLDEVAGAVAERRAAFAEALARDREAGEHVAAELRECARQEAVLHEELHRRSEALTQSEVSLQRARDRAAELEREVSELAGQLQLPAEPAAEALTSDERDALNDRLRRLARRREQLGPVNPLARQEYAEAVEHVEQLDRQRADLESALRELERLIADTDRQIKELFEQTFAAAARNFEQVAAQLFPGGSGRLRLVAEHDRPARVLGGETPAPVEDDAMEELPDPAGYGDEELLGVEIELTPGGKDMKRLSLLSGGEKSLTALAFLFAVFLARPCPFYILDEVEAALDDLNIDRFLELLRAYSKHAQFIVVTHQRRTMEAADSLYGVSMGGDGVSKVISRRLPPDAQAAA